MGRGGVGRGEWVGFGRRGVGRAKRKETKLRWPRTGRARPCRTKKSLLAWRDVGPCPGPPTPQAGKGAWETGDWRPRGEKLVGTERVQIVQAMAWPRRVVAFVQEESVAVGGFSLSNGGVDFANEFSNSRPPSPFFFLVFFCFVWVALQNDVCPRVRNSKTHAKRCQRGGRLCGRGKNPSLREHTTLGHHRPLRAPCCCCCCCCSLALWCLPQ